MTVVTTKRGQKDKWKKVRARESDKLRTRDLPRVKTEKVGAVRVTGGAGLGGPPAQSVSGHPWRVRAQEGRT